MGNERKTFKNWYEKNKDDLSAKRKAAYRSDPVKREEAKRRAKETRKRRRDGEAVQRVLYREHRGKTVPVYSTGYVACSLGCSNTMILNWERRGWIPPPVFDEPHRLYLDHQLGLMQKLYDVAAKGKAKNIARIVERIHDDW